MQDGGSRCTAVILHVLVYWFLYVQLCLCTHADAADTNRKCIQVDYLIFMRNLEVYIIYSIKAYLSILEYYLRSEKNATMSYVPRKVVHV
jgi:hypothetical protein